jgi:hypothetical protein
MDALTAVIVIVALALGYLLLSSALVSKGDMRVGAKMGGSTFFLEVKEPKKPNLVSAGRDSSEHVNLRPPE